MWKFCLITAPTAVLEWTEVMRMAMRLTEDNVYLIEHKIIRETGLWDDLEDEKRNIALMAYVSGINDMAQAIVTALKDLGR